MSISSASTADRGVSGLLGLWIGWRYTAIGIGIAVLTLVGFFLLPMHFLLWMAGVGGGALILTGLWLRRA